MVSDLQFPCTDDLVKSLKEQTSCDNVDGLRHVKSLDRAASLGGSAVHFRIVFSSQ
uniref:Uncharacterized protein n=1 Tax=Arundo donax TaxID=35708 RepID=A0A0A9T5V0_ARUDO